MQRLIVGIGTILLGLTGLLVIQIMITAMGLDALGWASPLDDESSVEGLEISAVPSLEQDGFLEYSHADSDGGLDAESTEDSGSELRTSDVREDAGDGGRRGGEVVDQRGLGGVLRMRRARLPASSKTARSGLRSMAGTMQQPPEDQGGQVVWHRDIGITWSKNRDTLYGFSVTNGTWSALRIPVQDSIIPYVSNSLGVVRLSRGFAAYSGTASRWDVLELEHETNAMPSLSSHHITLETNDHLYTFAESLGKWTSPTDPRLRPDEDSETQSLDNESRSENETGRISSIRPTDPTALPDGSIIDVVVGDPARVLRVPVVRQPPGLTDGLAMAAREAEEQSIAAAIKLRDSRQHLGPKHPEHTRLQTELRAAVSRAFDARKELQTRRLQTLEERLKRIRQSLQARVELQERIIERRVEELMDPEVDWQSQRDDTTPDDTTPDRPDRERAVGSRVPDAAAPPTIELPAAMAYPKTSDDQVSAVTEDAVRSAVVEESLKSGDPQRNVIDRRDPQTGSVVTVTSAQNPFDWDTIEALQNGLNASSKETQSHKVQAEALISVLNAARIPWSEASTEHRQKMAVELMRFGGGARFRGALRLGSRRRDDDDDESAGDTDVQTEVAEDEERYEQRRRSYLSGLQGQFDAQLKRLEASIQAQARVWKRYQGTLEDQRLDMKQAALELEFASGRYKRTKDAFEHEATTESRLNESRLAHEKARIALERAELHMERLRAIEKDRPGLDPEPYRQFIQEQRKMLEETRQPN